MAKNIAVMVASDLGMVDPSIAALEAEFGPFDPSAAPAIASSTKTNREAASYDFPAEFAGYATTSEKVRKMLAAGWEVKAIAKKTGMRYQHVRNISKQTLKRA